MRRWARALLLAVTIAAAKKKKRSRKPPATEKVKLTPGDYCLACLAFVEDYHKSISDIYQRNAATARESSVGPEEISGEIERRFEEYSETVQGAGRYLRQEALHRVLSSVHTEYDGQGEADERREVMQRKRRLCVDDLGACVPAAVEAEDAARGGACDVCAAVAVDFDFVARRGGLHEAPRDRGWLVGELEGACADAAYRHGRPAAVEAACEAMLDDHEDAVVRAVEDHFRFLRIGNAPSATLERRLCAGAVGACGDAEL